jgi:hypothetical protein
VMCRGLAMAAVLLVLGVAAGGASASTINWAAPVLVDHQQPFATTPSIQNVACPSAHLCVGLQPEGVVTSTNPAGGAAAWHATSFLGIRGYTGDVFGALTCAPNTHFCAAADEGGDLMTTTNPAGGEGSWKLTRLPGASMDSLSCPTAKLCFATDGEEVAFSKSPAKASAWRAVPIYPSGSLDSISCPSAHFCAATASGSITAAILTSANPTGGPRAWHATHFPYDQTNFAFSDVSCPSLRLCVASDAWGNIFTSTHPQRRGWRWTRPPRVGGFQLDARTLSCPSTRLCVSVSVREIASSTNPAGGGRTWKISPLPTQLDGAATVACAPSLCVAGDSGDNLLLSRTPGAGAVAWGRFNLGQGYNTLESIACPSAGLCVAGDNAGNIVSSTNPRGGVWSAQALPASSTGGRYSVASMSCPSQSFCAAVSYSSILTSTDPTGGQTAWTATTLANVGMTSVSCPSPNLCLAGGTDGSILTSADPTGGPSTWTSQQLGQPPVCDKYGCNDDSIEAVSCASAQLCSATDGPNLWVSTDPGATGATWTKSQMPRSSGVLTCPSDNLCVSANVEEIDATTNPSSPSPTWTVTHLPRVTGPGGFGQVSTGFVSSISCLSTQLCVAVDKVAGYAFSGNPTDPSSWTATKIDTPLPGLNLGPIGLTGVSCAPSGPCFAVDAAGKVVVGQVTG